jgi:hypothetical protein
VRRRIKDGEVPAELATFTASQWPGRIVAEQVAQWKAARLAYSDEHGWPGGALEAMRGALDVQWPIQGRPPPAR